MRRRGTGCGRNAAAAASALAALLIAGCGGSSGADRAALPSAPLTGATTASDDFGGASTSASEPRVRPSTTGRSAAGTGEAGARAAAGAAKDASSTAAGEHGGSGRAGGRTGSGRRRGRATGPVPARTNAADAQAAERTVREYYRRIVAQDGSLCTELLTLRAVEAITGRRGADAVAKCRRDITTSRGTLRVHSISSVEVGAGRRAVVKGIVAQGDRGREFRLVLVIDGGRYRIDETG